MFIRKQLARLSLVTLTALSCAAFAADRPGYPSERVSSGADKRLIVNDPASNVDLIGQIIGNWEATLTRTYGWQQEGVEQLRQRVSVLSAETLKAMAGATSWQRFSDLMLDAERAKAAPVLSQRAAGLDERDPEYAKMMLDSRKLLGDENRDLVFIPTKPCRIFDTRFEASGSPYNGRYTGANTKNFWAFNFFGTGDFSSYGGNTGCAENVQSNPLTFNGTAPYAVMIKLTIVGPAAAGSFVSAVRSGDANPAPNLVSAYCDLAGGAPCFATVVVPVCRGTSLCTGTRDISILSNMQLDLAGEVQGYFIKPQRTPLECTLSPLETISLATGFVGFKNNTATSACNALGDVTSVYCYGNSIPDVYLQGSGVGSIGFCAWRNLSGAPQNVQQGAQCCRTPGRN